MGIPFVGLLIYVDVEERLYFAYFFFVSSIKKGKRSVKLYSNRAINSNT